MASYKELVADYNAATTDKQKQECFDLLLEKVMFDAEEEYISAYEEKPKPEFFDKFDWRYQVENVIRNYSN